MPNNLRGLVRGRRIYFWLTLAAMAVAALSLLYPSTPSYDPWSWLIWGRELLHGHLYLRSGPSWKPFPVIFTTIFALFGSAQPNLWLLVARTGMVLSLLMVFKLTARLTWQLSFGDRSPAGDGSGAAGSAAAGAAAAAAAAGAEPTLSRGELAIRLSAPILAGLAAAIGMALTKGYLLNGTIGYSEEPVLAAALIAVELLIDGHPRQAFALGIVPALDRPEIWIVWGPFGLWLMWKDREARALVIGLGVLTLLLWFLPQKLGGGAYTASVSRALKANPDSATYTACPFCTELRDVALPLVLSRTKIAALLGIGTALLLLARRWWPIRNWAGADQKQRALIVLTVLGIYGYAWFVLVSIETQMGFAGNPRYILLGSAAVYVCGSSAYGWAAAGLARLVQRLLAARGRQSSRLPAAGALLTLGSVTAVTAVFVFVPAWVGRNFVSVPSIRAAARFQAELREGVATLVKDAGGAAAVRACGPISVEPFQVPMVAWYLDTQIHNVGDVNLQPDNVAPAVIIQDRPSAGSKLDPGPARIAGWEKISSPYNVATTGYMTMYSHCSLHS